MDRVTGAEGCLLGEIRYFLFFRRGGPGGAGGFGRLWPLTIATFEVAFAVLEPTDVPHPWQR